MEDYPQEIDEPVLVTKVEPADKNRAWLHCRRANGQRVVIKLMDHWPYFYAKPNKKLDNDLIKDHEHGYESIYGRSLQKITAMAPGVVGDLRKEYDDVHEADLPYTQRVIIDEECLGMVHIKAVRVKGDAYSTKCEHIHPVDPNEAPDIEPKIVHYDLEVSYEDDGRMPGRDGEARQPIVSIAAYDAYEDTWHNWNYRPEEPIEMDTVELEQGEVPLDCRSFTDQVRNGRVIDGEKEMLKDFGRWLQEAQPDILTGWNTNAEGMKYFDGFDDKYLIRRCQRKGIYRPFGKRGVTRDDPPSIPGVQLLDLLVAHRRINYYTLRRNSLGHVTKEVLGYELEKDHDLMDWYENDPEALVRYNMRDVEATYRLDQEASYSEWAMAYMHFAMVDDVYDIYKGTQVHDVTLLRMAKEEGVALPNRDAFEDGADPDDSEKVEGAVVQEPKKGVHRNVLAFDFTSLYPNMFMAGNLSPEMYLEEDIDGIPTAEIPIVSLEGEHLRTHYFRTDKEGFLPKVNRFAFEMKAEAGRNVEEARKQLATAREEGADEEAIERLEAAVERAELEYMASKIFLNSVYGATLSPYFRLHDRRIGESVTALGREMANALVEKARELGYTVVAGDTDSVYLSAKEDDLDAILEEGEELAPILEEACRARMRELDALDPEAVELEFEKVFGKGIFLDVKKKYAGLKVAEDGEKITPKVDITGFETVKADTPAISVDLQKDILKKLIKHDRDPEDVVKEVKELYDKVKTGEINPKMAAKQPRCKEDPMEKDSTHYTYKAGRFSGEELGIYVGNERFFCLPVEQTPPGVSGDPNFIALRDDDEIPEGFSIDTEALAEDAVRGKADKIFSAAGLELGGKGEIRAFEETKLTDYQEGDDPAPTPQSSNDGSRSGDSESGEDKTYQGTLAETAGQFL